MLYSIEGICLGDSKSEVLEKWGVPDEITFWGTAEWLVYSGERLVRLAPAGLEMTGVLEVEGRTLELDGQKLLTLNDLPEDARRILGKHSRRTTTALYDALRKTRPRSREPRESVGCPRLLIHPL